MKDICSKCQAQFKEDDQVVLDIFSKVTHADCWDENPGFVVTEGEYKDISESYANLVDG